MPPRKRAAALPALSSEVAGADLGDARLTQRLGLLVDSLADRSGESFPKALDDAELEAAYRFFGNAKVTPEAILAPHFRQTARRASAHADVLVVHDTTQFEFGGDSKREGLGRLIRPGQGFFGHFALAVCADGDREPLGLLGLETMFRIRCMNPVLPEDDPGGQDGGDGEPDDLGAARGSVAGEWFDGGGVLRAGRARAASVEPLVATAAAS